MYPSPEVEHHSEKDDDSSRSEKDMAAEGLGSLGKTVSGKGKFVESITANASHSEKHDVANNVIDLEDDRKVVVERELGKDVVEVKEVMDLINTVGLMKTVAGLSPCYEGLVKEFIVNIPEDIVDKNIKEFCKVFMRGKCITFSPTVINNFLGRRVKGAGELEATDNEVCREITARKVKGWPIKKHFPVGKSAIKYAILHKIGSANWVPTNHISTISNTLRRFIFVVGTKLKFDYGRFMFEQIVKHASTNAVKLPIAFPSMICGIILSQHPRILSFNDLPSRRKHVISVHYKLFEGSHVEDFVMTSAMRKLTSKVGTIVELKETCKELGEGIRVATTRKESLEALIASLERAEGENIEHAKEDEAHTSSERFATNDETSGNSISDADEVASSSSSD
ncbi:uncharacterized protein LOC127101109 [Lathyrus oleraceus]|uniref:uncharacterized protein LOC127101109 n=1 Tax=Pisum sativum TaxID=3888 RepID=UPI0021D23E71|nr:uncharacterized protein LOC127101109 [Pisum sativum]